jgi:hypothetical protein
MLIRAIGFLIFALTSQFVAWLSRIDVLDDLNIFALPKTALFLAIAIVVWIVIDGIAGLMRSGAKRQLMFWMLCVFFGVAAVVVPPFMSGDGLAIGLLRFFFGMWVVTIATYGIIAWAVEIGWRKRQAKRWKASLANLPDIN